MKGKVALVTGASRGIGRGCAIKLAQEGCNVVINYAGNKKEALITKEECESYGVEAIIIKGDVGKSKDCINMFKEAIAKFERVDILVNNAGITRDNLIFHMTEEDFDEVIRVNLKGAFLCMQQASKIMRKQRYGRIINISSVSGVIGNAGQLNYSASKAGIIGMTKSLAREVAGRKITVNAIAPGFIKTDMTEGLKDSIKDKLIKTIPAKRMGEVEEIANAVCFFASDNSSYITGQVLNVNGGMTM